MKWTFSDDQWMENFRMTKATFEILCDDLHLSFPDQARSVREPLQLDHRVAIAVYWMASSAEYHTIANLFGDGKSTVHKCIHDVCTAAENILDIFLKYSHIIIICVTFVFILGVVCTLLQTVIGRIRGIIINVW